MEEIEQTIQDLLLYGRSIVYVDPKHFYMDAEGKLQEIPNGKEETNES